MQGDRDRETDRQTVRQTETDTQTERNRQRDRETESGRHRQTDSETHRQTETDTQTERNRQTFSTVEVSGPYFTGGIVFLLHTITANANIKSKHANYSPFVASAHQSDNNNSGRSRIARAVSISPTRMNAPH